MQLTFEIAELTKLLGTRSAGVPIFLELFGAQGTRQCKLVLQSFSFAPDLWYTQRMVGIEFPEPKEKVRLLRYVRAIAD